MIKWPQEDGHKYNRRFFKKNIGIKIFESEVLKSEVESETTYGFNSFWKTSPAG
jgi:hypothetical protein